MNYAIIGASRGLGVALAKGLPDSGDRIFCISRTTTEVFKDGVNYSWIQADAESESFSDDILEAVGSTPVDVLIYNAGISGVTPFSKATEKNLSNVLRVNLESFVRLSNRLLPNILNGTAKTIICISSTCGLPNEGTSNVAYTASKFGLRGAVHALREELRPHGCKVTAISPGSIASDVDFDLGAQAALEQHMQKRIPVHDLVSTVQYVLSLSPASCVKEIHIPATLDEDV